MTRLRQAFFVFFLILLINSGTAVQANETFKIGLFAPFSGDNAEYGYKFERAITQYVDELNAAGGIHGHLLEIVREDDRSLPVEAANIARRFASDRSIVATIGSFSSTAALAAAPILERAGVVQLSPSSSHPDFTNQGTYMFRNVNTQDIEGVFNAEFVLNQLEGKRIAIVYRQDDWGLTASGSFAAAVQELDPEAEIVLNEAIIEGTRDYRPLLTRLQSRQPDTIYIALFYADAAIFAQQAKQAGFDVTFVTNSSLSNPEFIALGGEAVEGVYVPTNFFAGDPHDVVQNFITEYKQRWNEDPDQFAAIAYDSIALIAEAVRDLVEHDEAISRTAIRDALYKLPPYRGVSGTIRFDERGDVHKDMTWLIVRDGEFHILESP